MAKTMIVPTNSEIASFIRAALQVSRSIMGALHHGDQILEPTRIENLTAINTHRI
ncbi:MAG: hypothetical protein HC869_08655 [Rhodospirillales bacterium]|nr:hypothetical protein [Rhodospirillales bacterium]